MTFGLLASRLERSDCWESAKLTSSGYGFIYLDKKLWLAHRLSMSIFKPDEYKEDLMVLHRCNNRKCFNPDHLYMGTAKDNAVDLLEFEGDEKQIERLNNAREVKRRFKERRRRVMKQKQRKASANTEVTAVRLTREQLAALKMLPPRISSSVLIRTLVQEYLSGKLPYIHALVLQEAARTEQAIDRTKF